MPSFKNDKGEKLGAHLMGRWKNGMYTITLHLHTGLLCIGGNGLTETILDRHPG